MAASYDSQLGVGKTTLNELTHTGDGNIKGNKLLEAGDCTNCVLGGPNSFLSAQMGLNSASGHASDM